MASSHRYFLKPTEQNIRGIQATGYIIRWNSNAEAETESKLDTKNKTSTWRKPRGKSTSAFGIPNHWEPKHTRTNWPSQTEGTHKKERTPSFFCSAPMERKERGIKRPLTQCSRGDKSKKDGILSIGQKENTCQWKIVGYHKVLQEYRLIGSRSPKLIGMYVLINKLRNVRKINIQMSINFVCLWGSVLIKNIRPILQVFICERINKGLSRNQIAKCEDELIPWPTFPKLT